MSFTFPEFPEPNPLDGDRAWTAVFDSYDQRNDDIYYVISVHEAGQTVGRFVVQIFPLYWAGDDWNAPEFKAGLRQELHRLAVAGKTNTSHPGR